MAIKMNFYCLKCTIAHVLFKAVAIEFSGYASFADYEQAASDLLSMATADGYSVVTESYYTAGYDSPYVIMNRRNEVWYVLVEE